MVPLQWKHERTKTRRVFWNIGKLATFLARTGGEPLGFKFEFGRYSKLKSLATGFTIYVPFWWFLK